MKGPKQQPGQYSTSSSSNSASAMPRQQGHVFHLLQRCCRTGDAELGEATFQPAAPSQWLADHHMVVVDEQPIGCPWLHLSGLGT